MFTNPPQSSFCKHETRRHFIHDKCTLFDSSELLNFSNEWFASHRFIFIRMCLVFVYMQIITVQQMYLPHRPLFLYLDLFYFVAIQLPYELYGLKEYRVEFTSFFFLNNYCFLELIFRINPLF